MDMVLTFQFCLRSVVVGVVEFASSFLEARLNMDL